MESNTNGQQEGLTTLATARTGLKEVAGSRIIRAPLAQVIEVLSNSATKVEWLSGLLEEREVDRGAESAMAGVPRQSTVYQSYTLPGPLHERDYVIGCTWDITLDPNSGEAIRAVFTQQSQEHDSLPVKANRVRAALNLCVYNLEALPDDQGTRVDVKINVDPLGNFPIFLVNMYASSWPEENLQALEKQVLKAK